MNEFPRSFGAYVLLGELGRGGMGVVYQARHLGLNRPAAIKVLHRRPAAGSAELRRFLTEAEAAAVLEHPHIIPVYEAGEQDGQAFLSMKLLPGGTLAERMEGRPGPPEMAAAMVAKLARAVAHAHARGVLHRDIKPGNVLLDQAGEPCLADFGLAKLRDAAADFTSSQAILGTPAYMAPEVASSGPKAATVAADIYSLGALLYELLTGQPPFTGDSALAILERVKRQPVPSPRALNPGVPRDVEIICLKCLHREPRERYPTAAEVADDCDRFLRGEPVSARAPGLVERFQVWTLQHRLAAGLGGALLLTLLLGLGLTLWQWRRAEAHLRQAKTSAAELAASLARGQQRLAETALTTDHPEAGLLELARLLRSNPSNHLARLRLDAALSRAPFAWPLLPPLRHAEVLREGRFDAHDRWVVTLTQDGQAHLWESRTGARLKSFPHRVDTGPLALASADNLLATCPNDHTVQVWSLPSGDCVQSWSNAPAAVTALQFRPGDLRLAVGDQAGRVTLRHLDSATASEQIDAGEAVRVLAFDGQGRFMFTAGPGQCALWELGSGRKIPFDLPVREPVRWAEFSPLGDRLLAVGGQDIHVWNATNGQSVRRLPASSTVRFATFDPTGSWVASGTEIGRPRLQFLNAQGVRRGIDFFVPSVYRQFSVRSDEDLSLPLRHDAPVNRVRVDPLQQMVLSASSDGSARFWHPQRNTPLAHAIWHRMPVLDACFSQDGQRVLTICGDGTACLWARPRDTQTRVSWEAPAPVRASALAPDGSEMAVALEDRLLFFSSAQPGPPRREVSAPLSPDRLVFDSTASRLALVRQRGEVLLLDPRNGKTVWGPVDCGAPIHTVRFSDDARILAVSTTSNLHLWPVEPDARKPIAVLPHRGGQTFAISGGGRRLACLESESELRLYEGLAGWRAGARLRHGGSVRHVCFSPDGRLLATGGVGYGARVWEAATGQPLTAPLAAGYEVSALVFSPDSRLLLACSRDGAVRVWDAARLGAAEPTILPHQLAVKTAVFSPNAEWIATVDGANQVRLWHARTGLPMSDPWLATKAVRPVFTPDGQRLIVESEQPGFDAWDLPVKPLPPDLLVELVELVTGRQVEAAGSHRDLSEADFVDHQRKFINTFGTNGIPQRLRHFDLSSPPPGTVKLPQRPRVSARP
jgi:eukaryotic-like serine/threonine-protein kinase